MNIVPVVHPALMMVTKSYPKYDKNKPVCRVIFVRGPHFVYRWQTAFRYSVGCDRSQAGTSKPPAFAGGLRRVREP